MYSNVCHNANITIMVVPLHPMLIQHQSSRTVTVIDVNAEQEADAIEALHHPTTSCLCLTNLELASHSLLQVVEHREEPLQERGELLCSITQQHHDVAAVRLSTDIMY